MPEKLNKATTGLAEARFKADAKAFKDQQDKAISADENTKVDAEFKAREKP